MSIHATAISIEGEGVLLIGDSGTGKSDLALRLIHEGASLIADDQVELQLQSPDIIASAPENLAGIIELSGQGLIRMPYTESAPIRLVVSCTQGDLERLPATASHVIMGIPIPHIVLNPHHASATARIIIYLRALRFGDILPADWLATPIKTPHDSSQKRRN